MKVLLTGGSGFIGSHVVDKLIDAGPHGPPLRPVPLAVPQPEEVDFRAGDITDLDALVPAMSGCDAVIHLAAVADVNHVVADPSKAQEVNSEGTLDGPRGRPARRGEARDLRVDDLGLQRLPGARRRRGHAGRGAQPPLHGHEARRRALLQVVLRALRGRLHDPPLRHPVRPPGPRRDGARRLLRQGGGRRARSRSLATAASRGASSTSRTSPRASSQRFDPTAANRVYNLAGEEATTILDIAEAVRDHVADTGILHTEGRTGDFGGKEVSSETGRARARLERAHPLRRGLPALPRLAPRPPRAPQGPDPHRRHRRGP